MSGGGFRVSIPNGVKKTIENIKEITGNHSDEEIYTMLKECSMDPNETAQKLLLQDTFHEVKRKRDKRKENLNNKESAESRWRPGMQGRGNRGGRVYYSRRDNSHEFGGVRNSALGKENGIDQSKEKGVSLSPLPTSQEKKSKETSKQASITSGSTRIKNAAHSSGGAGLQPEPSFSGDVNKLGTASSLPPPLAANKNLTIAFGTGDTHGQAIPSCSNLPSSMNSAFSSVACFSSLDPVLVPTHDSRLSGIVGAIGREVGSPRTPDAILPAESKLAAEIVASESGSTFLQGKMPSKSQGIGKNQVTESSQHLPSSAHGGSSVSRPLSNYNSRSQQVIGPQKVGPNKEWKPKPTNPNLPQGSGTTSASEVPTISAEVGVRSQPVLTVKVSEDGTLKVQRKLGGLHIQDRKHVIIPNHIHVPESERTGLSFGSIDASFGVNMSYITMSGPESEKSSTSLSETSHGIEETVEEQSSSNQNAYATVEKGNYLDNPQSPTHALENLPSGEGDVSSSAIPEYNEIKQESALPHGGHQYSVVHTTPNYSFGFVPPILGNQLAPFENTESQARDISRVPSYVVQQPFDPTSYYAQFYRSGADTDGRLSPFSSPGVSTKYNGNITVLSPQSSESPQEGGNPLVLSTATATPLVTQAAGVLQSSIAMTQQVVPVFRPPTGMHISHYPPNYIPYGYFSPFYVPPPAIHQFLNNGAFPQQPQAAYPAPPQAGAAAGVKYSVSQYKPGTNNAGNIGMPSGYGSYTSPASYNTSSTAIAGNSNTNEDLAAAASQFKESNNVYMTGQQSEGGSGVWITAAPGGRELQPTSFYNIGPAGIYHPAQTAATVHPFMQQPHTVAGGVDMAAAAAAAAASVYQQQQMNWPTSY